MTRLRKLTGTALLALALLSGSVFIAARSASAQTMPPTSPNTASVQLASGEFISLSWGGHHFFEQVTQICAGINTEVRFDTNTDVSFIQPGTCQSFTSTDGLVDVSPV